MAQERFADVVERFTSGFNGAAAAVSPEVAKQWQEELERNVRRMTQPGAPVDGAGAAHRADATPGNLQAQQVAALPLRVQPDAPHAGAVRAQPRHQPALHLRPAARRLVHRAHDPRGLRFLPPRLGRLRPRGQRPHVRGLRGEDPAAHGRQGAGDLRRAASCRCSATAWARRCRRRSWPRIPRSRCATSSTWPGRSTSRRSGCSGCGSIAKHFDVDRFVDTLGSVPADLVKAGFKLLKPTMDLSTNLNLWWNAWNDKYVEGFTALNKWANEYVAFPGEFFRQWVRDFYQGNKLFRGELVFGGPAGAPVEHPVPGVRRRRQGRLHRAAGVRARAHRRGGQPREGLHRAARRPHLADRRSRRGVALLAQGLGWLAPRSGEAGMSDPTTQLFDTWKRQLEESTQAWTKIVSQVTPPAAPADPVAFWRPVLNQGLESWARMFAQTPASPDLVAQWKQFLDQWIEAWSRVLGQAMNTEGFAQMMGRSLEQMLAAQAPAKKAGEQALDQLLVHPQPRLPEPAHRRGQADRRAGGAAGAGRGRRAGDPAPPRRQGALHDRQDDHGADDRGPRRDHARRRAGRHRGVRRRGRRLQSRAQRSRLRRRARPSRRRSRPASSRRG